MNSLLANPEFVFDVAKKFIPAVTEERRLVGCSLERFGDGRIHDSYKLSVQFAPRPLFETDTFLLQRLNTEYFREPAVLEDNYRLLTQAFTGHDRRHRLTAMTAATGNFLQQDEFGRYWRLFEFIKNSYSVNRLSSRHQAYEIARAYGDFLRAVSGTDPATVRGALTCFHDSRKHLENLQKAASENGRGRLKNCSAEFESLQAMSGLLTSLADEVAALPLRLTHNDTRLNNVLLDCDSHQALCAVDWDTLMPGNSAIDFGDLVRSAISLEPGEDLPKMFGALLDGYVAGAGETLTCEEVSCFLSGAELICLELAIRFLADYLQGDPIFRGEGDESLNNCRRSLARFNLLRSEERQLLQQLGNKQMRLKVFLATCQTPDNQ